MLMLSACAPRDSAVVMEPKPGEIKGMPPAEVDARAEAVRRNPVGYLHAVAENCRNLEQYTLLFTRTERRGFFRQLQGPEHIRCWFRREPFSVRMKWEDENIKYNESVYVAGQEGDKVRFVTRWWSPPLRPPPQVNKVDLQTPVLFGESQRPMTDFGLERMMARTLASYERADKDVVLTYQGLAELPDDGRTVHHLHLEYSSAEFRVPVQELYIDVQSDLPAGTILKLSDGTIDAAYFYSDIETNVKLTDADFLLTQERPAAEQSPTSAPAEP